MDGRNIITMLNLDTFTNKVVGILLDEKDKDSVFHQLKIHGNKFYHLGVYFYPGIKPCWAFQDWTVRGSKLCFGLMAHGQFYFIGKNGYVSQLTGAIDKPEWLQDMIEI